MSNHAEWDVDILDVTDFSYLLKEIDLQQEYCDIFDGKQVSWPNCDLHYLKE